MAMQAWCAQRLLASHCGDWVGFLPPDAWLHPHALAYLSHKTPEAECLQPYVTVAPTTSPPSWWAAWGTLAARLEQRVKQASRYHGHQGMVVHPSVFFCRSNHLEALLQQPLVSCAHLGLQLQQLGVHPVWAPHAIVVLPAATTLTELLQQQAQVALHRVTLAYASLPLLTRWQVAYRHNVRLNPWRVWSGLVQPSAVWLVVLALPLALTHPSGGWLVLACLLGGFKPLVARFSLRQTLHYTGGSLVLRPLILLASVAYVLQALVTRLSQGRPTSREAWRGQASRFNESLAPVGNELTQDQSKHEATLELLVQDDVSPTQAQHSALATLWADQPTASDEEALLPMAHATASDSRQAVAMADAVPPATPTTEYEETTLAEAISAPATPLQVQATLGYGQREVACLLTLHQQGEHYQWSLMYKTHVFESDQHSHPNEALRQLEQRLTKRGFTLVLPAALADALAEEAIAKVNASPSNASTPVVP